MDTELLRLIFNLVIDLCIFAGSVVILIRLLKVEEKELKTNK